MNEIILMLHVVLGVGCLLASVWLFVDVLHASAANLTRLRRVNWLAAIGLWLAFLVAG